MTRASSVPADLGTVLAERERMLAFLRRHGADRVRAEDVLQTAYLKALGSLDTLRQGRSVVAWFFRILRRAWIDDRRGAARGARALAEAGRRAADALARDEAALRSAVCRCVDRLLGGLEPGQRELLRRVDLEGASPSEVAGALGITPGNAAVRLHRARKALRSRLEAVCGSCTRHKCLDCHCAEGRASAV